jgi:hypothetical protein
VALRHLLPALALALGGLLTLPARAIEIWHSNTVFANQGQCAATLTLDSGGDEYRQVRLQAALLDKSGRRIASHTLDLPVIGQSSADRFANVLLEGEAVCGDGQQLQITAASAIVNGKRIDLLRSGQLTPRDFRPMRIRMAR